MSYRFFLHSFIHSIIYLFVLLITSFKTGFRSIKKIWKSNSNTQNINLKKYIIAYRLPEFQSLVGQLLYNHGETLFLQGLTRCKKEKLSSTLNAIILPHHVPTLVQAGDKRSNVIYERTQYEMLINIPFKSLLVGSPWTGKTCFLYYYMTRLLNSHRADFGPLPPTCYSSNKRPKVVIHKVNDDLTLYFLDELKAYTFKSINLHRLISCFHPGYILYYYDMKDDALLPLRRTDGVLRALSLATYPIIVAATPYQINEKYILNSLKPLNIPCRVHILPLWSDKDLITVYTHQNKNIYKKGHNSDPSLINKYILGMISIHGRTLNSIQYKTSSDLEQHRRLLKEAIYNIDFIKLWDRANRYYHEQNAFAYKYIFHMSRLAIKHLYEERHKFYYSNGIKLASRYVGQLIYETYLERYTQDELVSSIQMIIAHSKSWHLFSFKVLLDLYVHRQISTLGGSQGWAIRANDNKTDELQPFNAYMPIIRGDQPKFNDMIINTLYVFLSNFRHLAVYKSVNSMTGVPELNLIQADSGSDSVVKISLHNVYLMYNSLGLNRLTCGVKVNYLLVPLREAHKCVITNVSDAPMPPFIGDVSIIHLPPIFESAAVINDTAVPTEGDLASDNKVAAVSNQGDNATETPLTSAALPTDALATDSRATAAVAIERASKGAPDRESQDAFEATARS